MIAKFFTLIMVLLLLAVIVAVSTAFVLWLEWPPLFGVVIVAVLGGLVLCILSVKKLLMWRNKKRFVAHIMKQDTLTRANTELGTLRPIRQIWEHGMAHLRRSPLRQQKNPVYALPWFLMLGEQHSGKTTLLDQTGGVRPLGESMSSSSLSRSGAHGSAGPHTTASTIGVGPTSSSIHGKDDSLSWMFLPDAVILEASARYAGNLDAGIDARDWEEFLTLLAAERSREPLNGALITISTPRLQSISGVELSDMANNLRNRLMQITMMLGSRFPVYVVVTQLDALHGMPDLLACLPEQHRDQTLGSCISPTAPLPMKLFVSQSLAQAEQQLRFAISERAANDHPPKGGDLQALAELRTLKDNLLLFMDVLFRSNPHQPSLMPRGLFLTSVLNVDNSGSTVAPALAFIQAQETEPASMQAHAAEMAAPAAGGLFCVATADAQQPSSPKRISSGRLVPCFLGELFFRILPGDRKVHKPLDGFWAMKSRIIGTLMATWYVGLFCLCGLFALTTLYNWHIFQTNLDVAESSLSQLPPDVVALYAQNKQIRKLNHAQAVWWLPSFGLNRIGELEHIRIVEFEKNFYTTELTPFFQDIEKHVRATRKQQKNQEEHFQILQRLMWLSKAVDLRRETGSADKAFMLPFPVTMQDEQHKDGVRGYWNPTFGNYFVAFLNRANDETLNLLTIQLENTTMLTLGAKGVQDFSWLIAGINASPQISTVYLEIFLPHRAVPTADSISIPPVYTAAGYQEISMFMDGLLTIIKHTPEITTAIEQFWKRYHRDYAQAWSEFGFKADSIWSDEFRLNALDDLLLLNSIESTPQVELLNYMGKQLEPLIAAKAAPKWVINVVLANAMLELTADRWNASSGNGEVSSLSLLYASLHSGKNPIGRLISADLLNLADLRSFFNASAGLYSYYNNLSRLSKTMLNPEASFQMVQAHYGGLQYGKTDESPYTLAAQSLEQALNKLPKIEKDKDVARSILSSQLRFMAHAIIVRAADVLDDMWVAQVVAPGQLVQRGGAVQEELTALFGEKGLVNSFTQNQAKAFLTRDRAGYHAASWEGLSFPFTEDFLFYIQQGQAEAVSPPKDSYLVTLRSDPTSVNINAVEKPQSTIFSLACQGAPVSLQNDNYPKQLSVSYKPKECGAATLSIRFPSLTLTRSYPDFPAFLSEFMYGERVFTPHDFPEQAEALTGIGVREIMVRILPDNAAPVLAGQHASVPVMPERITFSR